MDIADDEVDLVNLITGGFDVLASQTRWPGWKVDDDEAATVARPAARILARHAALAETVRVVADPVALIVAACAIALPRYMMYKAALAQFQVELQENELNKKRQGRGGAGGPMQPPPPVGTPGTADGPPVEVNINPDTAKATPGGKPHVGNFAAHLGNNGNNV